MFDDDDNTGGLLLGGGEEDEEMMFLGGGGEETAEELPLDDDGIGGRLGAGGQQPQQHQQPATGGKHGGKGVIFRTPMPTPDTGLLAMPTPGPADGMDGAEKQLNYTSGSTLGELPRVQPALQMGDAGKPATKELRGDPNVYSLTGSCLSVRRSYKELEESVTSVFTKAANSSAVSTADEQGILDKLQQLNSTCDDLCVLLQRKIDILAVERMLELRTESQRQQNPQDFIQTMAENLCVSRSQFQRVLEKYAA